MILKRVELKNIKSYYPEESIDFDDKINVLVGPNGGGKSNLFEIIQGIINNILFKHVTLKPNPYRTHIGHPHKNLAYLIEPENIDQANITQNLLDRHFSHSTEPALVQLVFYITSQDISNINIIESNKEKIINILKKNVAGSEAIINLLHNFSHETNFSYFENKELKLGVFPPDNLGIQIVDYGPFPPEKHLPARLLFELIQYLNVFYEISVLFSEVDLSPVSRYFGPHRYVAQPQSNVFINLSTLGNLEDGYTKGINATKENTPSLTDSSYTKLCMLTEMEKQEIIETYKKYLKKYLNIQIDIRRVDNIRFICEYEIEYTRPNGVPMKLSSGEKEFFNLITGLILSGITNGIVLLDEPELHLHAQWQQIILDLIFDLSEEFSIQFFIVTHSPKFINEKTLPHIFRVSKEGLYSHIIKPTNPIANSELKDLVQFLNSTNNEKIFFTQKVLLVEGISDQIIFTDIIQKLKSKINSDCEIEVLPVGSKNNLFKFRKLLNEWKIDNYIIADLDYIKEIRKDRNIIFQNDEIKQIITNIDNSGEINTIIAFSKKKLQEILCTRITQDGRSIVKLIAEKSQISKKAFLEEFDKLSDYLIQERAIKTNNNVRLSAKITSLFEKLSKNEKLLILEKGEIENYYLVTPKNKIENALEVVKTLDINLLDSQIESFLTDFLS